jgi:hypothetical protein
MSNNHNSNIISTLQIGKAKSLVAKIRRARKKNFEKDRVNLDSMNLLQ